MIQIYHHHLQIITQQQWLDGVECTVKIKGSHSHKATGSIQVHLSTLQLEDDGVVNYHMKLICKFQRIH